jgi:PAS domain S-box-containing protein
VSPAQDIAAFLRDQAPSVSRRAARNAASGLAIGRLAAWWPLRSHFASQVRELARLLENHGEDGPRLFGEACRRMATTRLGQLTLHEAIEEVTILHEAVLEAWYRKRGTIPLDTARVLAHAFGEAAAQVADLALANQRAEGAGFQEAALLETVVHHLEEAIMVVEADGVVSYATPAVQRVLGVPPRAVIGLKPEAIAHLMERLDMRDGSGAKMEQRDTPQFRALATRKPVQTEIRIRRPGGKRAVLEVYAAPVFDETGELRGVILTLRDHTELHRGTQALQQAYSELRTLHERMLARSRNEAVGELAGRAAHRLNNQLNAITLRASQLKRVAGAERHALAIESKVREIAGMVQQLQALGANRAPGEPEAVDLSALARVAIDLAAGGVVAASLEDVPPVMVQRELLLEVVTALILGVRDICTCDPKDAGLWIETASEGRLVTLRVGCNRALVNPETLERAFSTPEQGGLSLTDARETLLRWGGNLLVHAKPNEGPLLEAQLPAAGQEPLLEPTPLIPTKVRPARAARVVLIVDDEPGNAAMLADLLRGAGVESSVATNGAEAIALLGRVAPDAALVDWILPDMEGLQVMQTLKQMRPGMKVALVSGLVAGALPDVALADAVLAKPIEPAALSQFLGLPQANAATQK